MTSILHLVTTLFALTTTTTFTDAYAVNQVSSKAKRPTTYFIDGNNFMGQRGLHGLPRHDGDKLAEKLIPISSPTSDVVLVFDGRKDKDLEFQKTQLTDGFVKVNLQAGTIADDYILDEIHDIRDQDPNRRVKLVTADKLLRKSALGIRPTVKDVINPKVFWKKYVPRMSGMKKNFTPHLPRGSAVKDEED